MKVRTCLVVLGFLGSSSACSGDEAAGAGGGGGNPWTFVSGSGAAAGVTSGTASTGTASTGTGGTASTGAGGNLPAGIAKCGGKIYECGDTEDNDDDGLTDAQDPDCLGVCDNSENSYYPDLPGMTGAECKVDCFWDNGNGSGNDDCYWDHQCDPLEVGPAFPPEQDCAYDPDKAKTAAFTCAEAFQMQSAMCLGFCKPLAPNGCDCFGCCEVPGAPTTVWLGSYDDDGVGTCTLADVGDPAKCKPCTQVPGCANPCAPCEICIGKPAPDPGCGGGTGGGGTGGASGTSSGAGTGGGPLGSQCDPGIIACGLPGQGPCAAGFYCVTGCCIAVPA